MRAGPCRRYRGTRQYRVVERGAAGRAARAARRPTASRCQRTRPWGLGRSPTRYVQAGRAQRTTRHLSPAVGFRATFRHPLLVPGNFDSLDKWDYSVHWGTIDASQGWITSFAAQLPITIVADGAGISFPTIVPYWQQILRRKGATQDASQWAEGDDFLYPSQVAQLFAPANRMPGTSVYRLASRVSVHGFDVAEGRVHNRRRASDAFYGIDGRQLHTYPGPEISSVKRI